MARKTAFTCDGCGEEEAISLDKKKPDDWKDVQLSWSGFAGFPTSREDGTAEYDLCPTCAKRLIEAMNPLRWPRAQETTHD